MRICFVSTYPPIECGIGTYTKYLTDELKLLNNEIYIVSQIGAQGKNVFPVYSVESNEIASQIFNTSTKITPDLVHIQHEYGLYGLQKGVQVIDLIARYRMIGTPVVVTLHTVGEKLERQEKIILGNIVNESSAVIVHEKFQKDTLAGCFGHEEKVYIIPHGVRDVNAIQDAKKKLHIENKKAILLCGYFRPTKGFHKIVDIFTEVCEKLDDVVLVIAGKMRGYEYLDYQKKFFNAIKNSPVSNKIIVLRGQFPQYTFDTILSASDIAVLPYEKGSQSGILAQCTAFNKPVVTSNLKGLKNWLDASGCGLVANDDSEYTNHICRLLTDTKLYNQCKANMRRYVKEKVNWGKIAKAHREIYHKIANVPCATSEYIYWQEPS